MAIKLKACFKKHWRHNQPLKSTRMEQLNNFDVIIVGGSYAGLSAALALGRSLKRILVIDGGKPCNRQTPHSHNFLTQDGKSPAGISAIARNQVADYSNVSFYDGLATTGQKTDEGFEISTDTGDTFYCQKLIFATGINDIMPEIPGFADCWGISVIHCPYCHGFEHKGKPTGIMAPADKAFHLASLVNNLTDKIYVLTPDKSDLTEEQLQKFEAHHIQIITSPLVSIEHEAGYLHAVRFEDGFSLKLDAMYAAVPFVQQTSIPESLGCTLTEHGYLDVDSFQKTPVPGIYACGDNSSPFRSVSNAVYTGNVAGAMVNMELTNERF